MKSKIHVWLSGLLILVVFGLAFSVKAEIKKATLINELGDKVVVKVNSTDAQYYFGLGYVLMGNNENLGALPGPNIASNYLCVNGICDHFKRQSMTAATTTICALRSPAATSTLMFASTDFKVSSTSASIITIAKATTAYATTTILGSQIPIAANAQANIVASSTSQLTPGTTTFAPSEWLVIGMQGGTGTFSPTGKCQAIFRKTE